MTLDFTLSTIHFAFGSLHRTGETDKQLVAFQEHILAPQRLRAFACPEFLPVLNNPGAMWADPNSATPTADGGVTFQKWVPSPRVGLLPCDVWMISFVNIPLSKLRAWLGANHYGRLGIAFTHDFVKRTGIRRVHYYQYPDLAKDPAVIAYNTAVEKHAPNINEIANDILGYRKPARLWPEINGLFAMLKVSAGPEGAVAIQKMTYSRYEVGYHFELEKEARKVMSEAAPELAFDEKDVLAIVAPSTSTAERIQAFLATTWKSVPSIVVVEQ